LTSSSRLTLTQTLALVLTNAPPPLVLLVEEAIPSVMVVTTVVLEMLVKTVAGLIRVIPSDRNLAIAIAIAIVSFVLL
jgi:hypothetical protein